MKTRKKKLHGTLVSERHMQGLLHTYLHQVRALPEFFNPVTGLFTNHKNSVYHE